VSELPHFIFDPRSTKGKSQILAKGTSLYVARSKEEHDGSFLLFDMLAGGINNKKPNNMSLKETHKSMAGPSQSSDHDSSSSLNTNSMFVSKRDIGPLILAAVILLLGLAVCLITYFTVATKEVYDTQKALEADSVAALADIQASFDQITITAKYIYSLFDGSPLANQITQEQFNKFILSEDGDFPAYLYSVSYSPLVMDEDRDAFVASQRALGGKYANYEIKSRNAVRGKADYYTPITLYVPDSSNSSIGLDLSATATIASLISQANLTDRSALSSRYLLAAGYGNLIIFAPYQVGANSMVGVVTASIDTLGVVQSAVGSKLLNSGVDISLFSLNYTTNPQGNFAYSTISDDAVNGTAATAIAGAQCVTEGRVTLSNNVFRVVFSSTSTYINNHKTFDKYIGIIVSIVCTALLVCACFGIMFLGRITRAMKSRTRGKRRLQAMQDQYSATSSLLERLVKQDAIVRACMNAIPDFIVTLNGFGKITNTNKAFDEIFGYTEQRLENGLTIQWLLPSLESSFYREAKIDGDMLTIDTKALTAQEVSIDVTIMVRSLQNTVVSDIPNCNDLISAAVSDNNSSPEEHAYVIIGRKRGEKVE
jgi:hypothetical protein